MDQPEARESLAFFGLDGASGDYLLRPQASQLSELARHEEVAPAHLQDVRDRAQSHKPSLGVADTVEDPSDLAQSGWGVVFARDADPAIRAALSVLIDLRAEQAGDLFQDYSGGRGYPQGQSKREFLSARGAPPSGPVEPRQMPYYLLLVGSPEAIPYSLQYELDVQYAVGRISFDTPEGYARYAQGVVTAERANPRPRRVTLAGVANADDRPTHLSATQLVQPLAERLRQWQASQPDTTQWSVDDVAEGATDKAHFRRLLGGDLTPALLFTASHGVAFPRGHPAQKLGQGALVCRDWPGPLRWQGPLSPDFYLGAGDVDDDARLQGLIAFHFACFGAGTPFREDFPELAGAGMSNQMARTITPRPFVAPLAQRLLGHPSGGALAVIGHVERALGSSFLWSANGSQRTSVSTFEACLRRLMRGQPVGLAMEAFNQRYAELCAELAQTVRRINEEGRAPDEDELAQLWMGCTDARGYVVVGDPAVRLAGFGQSPPVDTAATLPVIVSTVPSPVAAPPVTEVAPSMTPANVRIEVDPNTGHITLTTGASVAGRPDLSPSGDVAYGWLPKAGSEADDGPRSELAAGLRGIAEQLAAAVGKLASEVSTLSVSTYTGEDLNAVTYDTHSGKFVGPTTLRAFTSIRFDGETASIVPATGGALDERLWQIHTEMVARAQAHRAEFVSAAAAAASSLFSAIKGS